MRLLGPLGKRRFQHGWLDKRRSRHKAVPGSVVGNTEQYFQVIILVGKHRRSRQEKSQTESMLLKYERYRSTITLWNASDSVYDLVEHCSLARESRPSCFFALGDAFSQPLGVQVVAPFVVKVLQPRLGVKNALRTLGLPPNDGVREFQ